MEDVHLNLGDVPATYSAEVRYVCADGSEGACYVAGDSPEHARARAAHTVGQYGDVGIPARVSRVVAFCRACEGAGHRPRAAHRRRTAWAAKRVRCTACAGVGHWSAAEPF